MVKSNYSAGLLMFRVLHTYTEYFLVHPGGPFFVKKDEGFWTIPKGITENEEDPETTARREFKEETGIEPASHLIDLGVIKQKGGKVVKAWGFRDDSGLEPQITSNTFEIEWPPKSGKLKSFAEIDQGRYFKYEQAIIKINAAQIPLLERLNEYLHKV